MRPSDECRFGGAVVRPPQRGVKAVSPQELLVTTALGRSPGVEDDDCRRLARDEQVVRDHDRRVTDAGFAKVIDLSVARPPGRVGKPVGTRVYMAPEQASSGVLTEATDVWGLGMVLYEGASGQRPFRGAGQDVQLRKHAEPARSLRRMPAALAATIDACLEPDPAARPDVADIEAALGPLAESE
jgi:serine/threonine protein kinase